MSKKKKQKLQQSGVPHRGLGQKEKQFLHVKEFSIGKPNELSFDVLEKKAALQDAKDSQAFLLDFRESSLTKQGSDQDDSAQPTAKETKKSKKGKKKTSQHGAPAQSKPAATAFMSGDSQVEIERRQRRRRHYRIASIIVVALVCVGLAIAGGYWAYQQYQRLSTSVGMLKEACSLIEQSDEVTVAIDDYFQTSFSDETVDKATELLGNIDSARDLLSEAKDCATDARDNLEGSDRDKQAAERALNTIAARETLLDTAEERLNDDLAAKPAIDALESAQTAIDEGNALIIRAASVVSDTTEENVNSSTKYTTSAQDKFNEAKGLIEQAKKTYPDADVSVELDYVNKRLEAASEALLSNAAILLQDRQTAESHNDAYNAADQVATQMAKSLPKSLAQPVIDAYAQKEEPLIEAYTAARNDAASNDSALRDYLG